MNPAPPSRRDERGFVTIQYVFAVGMAFVLLVLVANLLVDLYARGAVRDAIEEGTHAALPIDAPPNVCAARSREVLDGLLRGPIGRDIRVTCATTAATVTATANVRLASWFPSLVPDWTFTVRAIARRDQ
jgi:hypothetical protein